jgi:two-component system, LuxR family, sensor kinase FixL
VIGSRHVYSIAGVASFDKTYAFQEAIETFVHPDDRQRVVGEAKAMIVSGRVWPLEIRILRQDGQGRIIRTDGELVRDEHGEPARFIVVLSDITKAKADEARFESMAQQLRHASRLALMGELSAGIAHEVNQPLCSILNFAKACQNIFAQPVADLQRVREWTDAIAAAAARAGDIVRRFSGFARRSEIKLSPVSIEELVQDSLSLVRFEAQTRKVAVTTSFSEPGLQVFVHPVQIQQVLVNLLRNAIEAFGEGDNHTARVRVAVTAAGNEVHVSVTDNGAGLSPAQVPSLFSAFVTTKPDGLGLGLAISKTIVESYGGRIWAQSNPEGGAAFHFTLARRKGDWDDA